MPATEADYEKYSAWASVLNPDLAIDRRTCHRVLPLEVINASAPRTGTISMQEAFRILGYPNPYHYSSMFENARDSDMWCEALDAKYRPSPDRTPYTRKDFDQLLGHCGAVGDAPAMNMWKELVEAYPEANVVLVERDQEKWLKSMRQLVEGILNPVAKVLRVLEPARTGRILKLGFRWQGYW